MKIYKFKSLLLTDAEETFTQHFFISKSESDFWERRQAVLNQSQRQAEKSQARQKTREIA